MAVVLVVSVEESSLYDPNGTDGANGKDGMPVQQRHLSLFPFEIRFQFY
jgi:hypothetical protein